MADRPMLMSAPMVRAILAYTKRQTRRVAKIDNTMGRDSILEPRCGRKFASTFLLPEQATQASTCCPYGQPGDRLWVREAWKAHTTFDHLPPREIPESHVWYMADDGYKAESRFRQGMFMPRWASRITLEITDVRVERLQDISMADAIAEGLTPHGVGSARGWQVAGQGPISPDPVFAYRMLWESINGPESWAANPWVWVVEFKRVTP